MKKIILLALIVLIIPIVIIEDTNKDFNYHQNNYPDLPKDENWEFLRERVSSYVLANNEFGPRKYYGPILFELNNATQKDSLAVNEVLSQLKYLLPKNHIDYFKNYTGFNLNNEVKENKVVNSYKILQLKTTAITLNFNEIKEYQKDTQIIQSNIEYDGKAEINFRIHSTLENKFHLAGYHKPDVFFNISSNSSINQRKKIIEYELIKLIAGASEFVTIYNYKVKSEHSILNKFSKSYSGQMLSEHDKFFIKKIYSDDFNKEFNDYIYDTYPWRYAINYLDRDKAKVISIWVCIVLSIVLFLLGFQLLYKRKYKKYFFNYLSPVLYVIVSGLYVVKINGFITVPHSFQHWRQYISIHVILIIVGTFIALTLLLFDKYIIKNKMNFTSQLLLKVTSIFLIGVIPVIIIFLVESNNQPWYKLNSLFLVMFGFAIGRGVLLYLDYFSENLVKQKDVELSRLKEINAQAEVKLLQSQINPHFLYNALNSIASLAHKNADKTEQMALSLSDLFKYSINKKGEKMNTIANEVEMVQNYFAIEQIRFGDRLQFNIEVDKDVEALKIPMFIIQPLVENAVKHGISKVEDQGEITLKIRLLDANLEIMIIDNGPNFPEDLVSGHGLQTVHDLLKIGYGNNAWLLWENEPKKHISITIDKSVL